MLMLRYEATHQGTAGFRWLLFLMRYAGHPPTALENAARSQFLCRFNSTHRIAVATLRETNRRTRCVPNRTLHLHHNRQARKRFTGWCRVEGPGEPLPRWYG